MKFSCTKENLLYGMQSIVSVATKATHLPILRNVLIEATDTGLVLTATDLEMTVRVKVRAKVEEVGLFTLPAQLLTNYLTVCTGDRLDVGINDKIATIHADGQDTKMYGEDAKDFPLIPELRTKQEFQVSCQALVSGFKQVMVAVAREETRPEFTSVLLKTEKNTLYCAATDTYRLAEKRLQLLQGDTSQTSVLVPARSLQEFIRLQLKDDIITVLLGETQIGYKTPNIEFYSRLVDGVFPDYQAVLPNDFVTTVVFNKQECLQAVKATSLFARSGLFDINLHCDPETNCITMTAVNTQTGEQTTKLSAHITGEANHVVFNYKFFLDALAQFTTPTIKMMLVNNQAPVRFEPIVPETETTPDYFHVIVPIKP